METNTERTEMAMLMIDVRRARLLSVSAFFDASCAVLS